MEFIKYISPALITIVGNILLYVYLKNKYDKSLEEFKISYSGIYKKKIDIYREILKRIVYLKFAVTKYEYQEDKEVQKEIVDQTNELLNFLKYNKPFISPKVNQSCENIINILQGIFEAFYKSNKNISSKNQINEKIEADYWDAVSKLRSDKDLQFLEEFIVTEIKLSLKLDKL